MAHRFQVSQGLTVLYISLVTEDRLPVFQTDQMKEVLSRGVDEARKSADLLLFCLCNRDRPHIAAHQSTINDL